MNTELCPRCKELMQPRKIHDKDMVYVFCAKCQTFVRSYKNTYVKEEQ